MRNGQAVGRWGGGGWFDGGPTRYIDQCPEFLRIEQDEGIVLYECVELNRHGGKPHRDWSGATWETGPEDFTPAPDGRV